MSTSKFNPAMLDASTPIPEAGVDLSSAIPPGVVLSYAGSAAPSGWLLCYGQAVSRAIYNRLFTAIGTQYGVGDGSTTFNLPDLRGRAISGKDNMGGTAAGRLTNSGTGNPGIDGSTLGAAGGVDRYTLTVAQMPSHTHPYNTAGAGGNVGAGGAGYGYPAASTSSSAGNDNAHPIVQPTMVLNKIIRY